MFTDRCLTVNVYSDFTVPGFGCHVTVGSNDAVTDYVASKLVKKDGEIINFLF